VDKASVAILRFIRSLTGRSCRLRRRTLAGPAATETSVSRRMMSRSRHQLLGRRESESEVERSCSLPEEWLNDLQYTHRGINALQTLGGHCPFLPLSLLSRPSFPSLLIQLGSLGECCKPPQRSGWTPATKCISVHFEVKIKHSKLLMSCIV